MAMREVHVREAGEEPQQKKIAVAPNCLYLMATDEHKLTPLEHRAIEQMVLYGKDQPGF